MESFSRIDQGELYTIQYSTARSKSKPTAAPPWTPLFATAAAVITDTGGILSHCAVVARVYGIPAVVGIGVATTAIRDGQVIEVDGDAGVVRIIGDEV